MATLKLPQLPDRTPVKITFRASPELAQMLNEYCAVYRDIYQQPDETVEELIPFMLAAFMESDPQFKKARKRPSPDEDVTGPETTSRRLRTKPMRGSSLDAAAPSSDRNAPI